jgi:hypothetical protein
MRAKVKDWFSPDVPEVCKWQPQSLDDLHYYLEMTIGPDNEPGGQLFGLMVVSPHAWRARPSSSRLNRLLEDRRHLFLTEYSWQAVLDYVNKVLDICQDETWPEVARKLSQYFYWEYEGPHSG